MSGIDFMTIAKWVAGINDLESANGFLDGKYLRAFHRQFGRAAASPVDVHRSVPGKLNDILSWEAERVVRGDWTVACAGQRYQLDAQHEALSLVRRKVIVRTLRNGRVQLVSGGQQLKWRALPAGAARSLRPGNPLPPPKAKTRQPPAAKHPWRRLGMGVGREFWKGIQAQGQAVRLVARDSGRPSLRSSLPASRATSRANPMTRIKQPRGHSLVSYDGDISKEF